MSRLLILTLFAALAVNHANSQIVLPQCGNTACPPGRINCNCTVNIGNSGPFSMPSVADIGNCGTVQKNYVYSSTNPKPFPVSCTTNVASCCAQCTTAFANRTSLSKMGGGCAYWQFINYYYKPPTNQTCLQNNPCGQCWLYPVGSQPTCSADNVNCSTVGRPCSTITGDPHFVGAHGTRFEFNGELDKTFCLVSDRQLQINMKMKGYLDSRTVAASLIKDGKAVRTWLREVGILYKSDDGDVTSLVLTTRDSPETMRGDGFISSIKLDGTEVPLLKLGDSMGKGDLTLSFIEQTTYGPFDMDVFNVKVGNLLDINLKVRVAHPLLQTPENAEAHFNLVFNNFAHTSDVHGVLGQTYRANREQRALDYSTLGQLLHHPVAADGFTGKGFLDGVASDYTTPSITSPDCKFSVFNGGQLPTSVDVRATE